MKTNRQSKIIEIIQKNEVETQDELSALLEKDGFRVTQATVSRETVLLFQRQPIIQRFASFTREAFWRYSAKRWEIIHNTDKDCYNE